jgi:hypothetical protein
MNDARPFEDRDALASLDRLAAGDLDEGARRALFAWLDREPQRWRRCALVLLEAREWEGALDDWTAEMRPDAPRTEAFRPARGRPTSVTAPLAAPNGLEPNRQPIPPTAARIRLAGMLAVAASVAIAFGLGMAADRQWTASRGPIAEIASADDSSRAIESRPNGDSTQPPKEGLDKSVGSEESPSARPMPHNDPVAAAASSPDRPDLVPAYVRSQLERRGYRVDSRRQLVSVSLPGGRKVTLPVEKWNLNYIGDRVY